VLLVKHGTELHPESHWDVIQVHLVNENEDKIVSFLEKLKLLASIVSDSDVLFQAEYSEMSNSFQEAPGSCLCYQKNKFRLRNFSLSYGHFHFFQSAQYHN
jgi:hypothetical protein